MCDITSHEGGWVGGRGLLLTACGGWVGRVGNGEMKIRKKWL